MSIQDPRERPLGQEQQAKEKHKRFEDETSDFLSYLNLWNHLQARRKALSSSAFRRRCGPSTCITCGSANGGTCTRS